MATAAVVNTPAERARQARILQAAATLLAAEGEQGLQMKQLAQKADVALATLYRYFPSKDHVLGAIALERWKVALQKIETTRYRGQTPGERAGDLMLGQFRRVQRDPEYAAALERVANAPDRSTGEYMDGIRQIASLLVRTAIEQDGTPITEEQQNMLSMVMSACGGAINAWLAGTLSADQTRSEIQAAARLFDLPPEIIRQYLWID
jgi:AcrR family transcriptional regulator